MVKIGTSPVSFHSRERYSIAASPSQRCAHHLFTWHLGLGATLDGNFNDLDGSARITSLSVTAVVLGEPGSPCDLLASLVVARDEARSRRQAKSDTPTSRAAALFGWTLDTETDAHGVPSDRDDGMF